MFQPLKDIKVIDCTTAGAGPSCTKLLREYGAQVIWIEPTYGAATRAVFKYDFYCAGKRSLAIDLKTQEGQKLIKCLLSDADVFVSNYRTKALRGLHLDYKSVAQINEKIVYASLTAYGEYGEDADKPGYDPAAFWARGGMLRDFGYSDRPMLPPVAFGDIASGQALAGGICAALLNRVQTGKGCKVFTSLLGQASYMNHDAMIESQYGERYPKDRKHPKRALLNIYCCADGKWIVIVITDRFDHYFWPLLKILGREDLVGDPRWTCFQDTMYEKAPEVVKILDDCFAKMTRDEAMRRLISIDVPCAKISSTEEMMQDPQVLANRFVFDMPSGDGKLLRVPANPVKFEDISSGTTGYGPGPAIGEHSVEILREMGIPEQEIADLVVRGIVCDGKKDK